MEDIDGDGIEDQFAQMMMEMVSRMNQTLIGMEMD